MQKVTGSNPVGPTIFKGMKTLQPIRTNFHTHTTWCDGKDSPENVIIAAIEKDFSAIGFSSHMAFPISNEWVIHPDKAIAYASEVRALQKKYAGKIEIYLGCEADYLPGVTTPEYSRYKTICPDYIIGSVHSVIGPGGKEMMVDFSPENLMEGIDSIFGGNVENFVKTYFRQQREMLKFDFDVLGHPDLLRKFNDSLHYIDESSLWYRRELEKTADAIAQSGKIVEVNTGAISRGWMNEAYPSGRFRDMLRERGVKFILNSDSHSADAIDCAFERFQDEEDFLDFRQYLKERVNAAERQELFDCPAKT